MAEPIIVTPLSRSIADAINKEMQNQSIRPTQFEKKLEGKVNKYVTRRIRKGSSGCYLRSYEHILDFLGLKLIVIPKHHPDILD